VNRPNVIPPGARLPRQGAQRGVSLIFALLALGAMLLAAVALVRAVDSGALVLGNLGFKQDATSAADRATEYARTCLNGGGSCAVIANLNADGAIGTGYYASSQDTLDPTGRVTSTASPLALVDWDANTCASFTAGTYASCTRIPATCPAANCGQNVTAQYLITRLCPSAGAVGVGNSCAQPASTAISNAADRGQIKQGSGRPQTVVVTPFYRIIVRTVGARGTASFTETIIH
jgi:type IV pilus assembly protein PilX